MDYEIVQESYWGYKILIPMCVSVLSPDNPKILKEANQEDCERNWPIAKAQWQMYLY